jgi:hypothetical protein
MIRDVLTYRNPTIFFDNDPHTEHPVIDKVAALRGPGHLIMAVFNLPPFPI